MKTTRLLLLILAALPVAAQRLPKTVIPTHYELTFAPDFSADTFRGSANIDVSVQQPLGDITLHAVGLTFDHVFIEAAGKTLPPAVRNNPQEQTITLSVDEGVPIGPARLKFEYSGALNRELRGLYLGRANGRKYAATQMEAADARRAFPCFDEPELKATFSISAIIDAGDRAVSNGTLVSDVPAPQPGKHMVRFATTPRMATYLVALVVGDFDCIEGGSDGIPMRVCATPDKAPLGKLALSMSESFMRWFHEYFGVRYPFGKLDHIGIPDFGAGAMENSGAIIYRDIFLLVDETMSSARVRKRLGGIVAHEMAHLWFGDLVTMRWWDDLWLNEGFATWMSSKPVQAFHPDWNAAIDDVLDIAKPMNVDSLRNTRPVKLDVDTPSEAEELFDTITYEKAAAVLGMLESYLGEEPFRKGISAYMNEHSFRNATADDFAAALAQQAAEAPVDRILDTFVKQPGVPLITVESSCVNNRTLLKLRQKRFFVDPRLAGRETKELWHIPVCMRSLASKDETCKVLADRKQTFRLQGCSAPVIVNANGKGYFVTSPSDRDLRQLIGRLDGLNAAEKITLLRDEWLLVRAARREIPEFLALAESILKTERERAVVAQILGSLNAVARWLAPTDQETYRQWLREVLRPLAAELGWEAAAAATEDPERRPLPTLALVARDPAVLAEARRRAREYFRDPRSIDPSLVEAVLSAAAVEGDEELYEQAVLALERAETPEQRQALLWMLANFRDRRLIRRTLERALLPETRATEARSFLVAIFDSHEGRGLAWEFLTQRWPAISEKIPPGQLARLVKASASFCDPAKKDEVRGFFTANPVEASERALEQTLETIDLCVQTTRLQAPKLAAWLRQRESTVLGPQSSVLRGRELKAEDQ